MPYRVHMRRICIRCMILYDLSWRRGGRPSTYGRFALCVWFGLLRIRDTCACAACTWQLPAAPHGERLLLRRGHGHHPLLCVRLARPTMCIELAALQLPVEEPNSECVPPDPYVQIRTQRLARCSHTCCHGQSRLPCSVPCKRDVACTAGTQASPRASGPSPAPRAPDLLRRSPTTVALSRICRGQPWRVHRFGVVMWQCLLL